MGVKKSQESLLRTSLITIVKLGLSVKATLSTTVNSIRTRRKNSVIKEAKEVVDQKPESSLANYKLQFEDIKPPKLKLTKKVKK